jgi:diacylglycerol kinase
MFASGSMTVDAQAWTHLNFLEEGGIPALLWDTLKDFGYNTYPEYSARELMTTGQLLRWEVKVKIPVCPTHPTWEEWEVKAQGLNLAVTVQKAALEALTTSYEKHVDLVASTAAKVIPYLSSIPDMGSSTKLFSLLRAILTTILNLSPQSVSPKLCLTPIK